MNSRWNSRNRLTKQQREEILAAFLADPIKGTTLAIERGLTAAYAYKLAHARGLLPNLHLSRSGREAAARNAA